jgi:hypothetical protein
MKRALIIVWVVVTILSSGCSMLPNSYKTIDLSSWETVDIYNTNISVELPRDKKMLWKMDHARGQSSVFLPLAEITPNSIWEPLSFSYIEITVFDLNANPMNSGNLLPLEGQEPNKVYRYFAAGNLSTACDIQANDHLWIKVYFPLQHIESFGYVFHRHDPNIGNNLNDCFRRVLWSLKCNGVRLLNVARPEDIVINRYIFEQPAKEDEDLFNAFGY